MKFSDFSKASNLVRDLDAIDEDIKRVADTQTARFNVVISGDYQGGELVEAVRPAALAHLQKKRGEVLQKLVDLGVDVHE